VLSLICLGLCFVSVNVYLGLLAIRTCTFVSLSFYTHLKNDFTKCFSFFCLLFQLHNSKHCVYCCTLILPRCFAIFLFRFFFVICFYFHVCWISSQLTNYKLKIIHFSLYFKCKLKCILNFSFCMIVLLTGFCFRFFVCFFFIYFNLGQ